MQRLVTYFFRGLVVLVPVVVTAYVFYLLFTSIDQLLPFAIPGLGVLVAASAVLLIGWMASNLVTNRLVAWMEKGLSRVPVVRTVYNAVREVTAAVLGDGPRFQHPVRVELVPDGEIFMLGFVTRRDLSFGDVDERVAVYLPQAYNIGGQVVLVSPDRIEDLAAENTQVMSFLLSGGLAGDLAGKSEDPERTEDPERRDG